MKANVSEVDAPAYLKHGTPAIRNDDLDRVVDDRIQP
jgi:hypothetical protein